MLDTSQLVQYMYGFFVLLTVAGIAGAFKAVDWLIEQKYVTHTKCEKCRGEIYKTIATDHDLLQNMDGKMDIMIEYMEITNKDNKHR